MTIRDVRVHILNNTLPPDDLTRLLGVPFSHAANRVAHPPSDGRQRRALYTWSKQSECETDSLGDHIDHLRGVLVAVSKATLPVDAEVFLTVTADSTEDGHVFEMSPRQAGLLSTANCRLWLDVYTPARVLVA